LGFRGVPGKNINIEQKLILGFIAKSMITGVLHSVLQVSKIILKQATCLAVAEIILFYR